MTHFDVVLGKQLRMEGKSIMAVSKRLGCCPATALRLLGNQAPEESKANRVLGQKIRRMRDEAQMAQARVNYTKVVEDCDSELVDINAEIAKLQKRKRAIKAKKNSIQKKYKIA